MFIGRQRELAQLETLYATGQAALFILYGRRRVGKTELLRHLCQDKPGLFFVATMASDIEQLAEFSQVVWRATHPDVPPGFTFPSWESAFGALADLPGRPVVVLDEFTYLMSGNRSIPSILQKVWDEKLQHCPLLLVLCGSYIGMMETEVLGYHAPLYGRRSGNLLLLPLELTDVPAFFPRYAPVRQLEAWAVLGGMPYYLSLFTDARDLFVNIRQRVLDPQGILYHEPRLLLMEELREPRNYFSILRAIAHGRTRLGEIDQAAGLGNPHTTGRYLDILQQMRYVRREVPVTESRPEKSKKGLYRITDPFLRFWFRYVHPHSAALEMGLGDAILEREVRPGFDGYVAGAFEDAARFHVARLARANRLPFRPDRIGGWWDRTAEIDVLAIGDREQRALAGECKWSVRPVGVDILEDLKMKTQALLSQNPGLRVDYALFSKSGFTPALKTAAMAEGVLLVTAEEMMGG
jgi:AAA+ ATPase superfamily predicted ATPase